MSFQRVINFVRTFQNFGQQQFDYSNKKNNDGDINDLLYSGEKDIHVGLPQHKSYQPMARNVGMDSVPVVTSDKMEKMNRLKEQ